MVRHGETNWNKQNRIQGQTDIPLSDAGRDEVKKWVFPDEFKHFRWVSSPLKRATETARILGHDPGIQEALREMSWGQWEGQNWGALQARLGAKVLKAHGADSLDFRPPDGESPRDIQNRLRPWLKNLKNPTVCICHKGIIQVLHAIASGWNFDGKPPLKVHHGVAYLYLVDEGIPYVDRMNIFLVTASPGR